jgi:hypothetical protein
MERDAWDGARQQASAVRFFGHRLAPSASVRSSSRRVNEAPDSEELGFEYRESCEADSGLLRSRRVRGVNGAPICAVAFCGMRQN